MYFHILVTILSLSRAAISAPSLDLEGVPVSVNSGFINRGVQGYGGFQGYGGVQSYGGVQGYGGVHGYGSLHGHGTLHGHHHYPPQINRYEGLSSIYAPGRQIPYIPYVYQTPSLVSPGFGTLSRTGYRNRIVPQRLVSQSYQMYNSPDSCSAQYETVTPISSNYYYNVPFLEIIDTYKIYNNISKAIIEKKKSDGFFFDSSMKIDNEEKHDSLEEQVTNNEKTEPVLQLTYLGYVPQSSFRGALQSERDPEPKQTIPFYMLDYDDNTPETPRSSSGYVPAYVSPVRLHSPVVYHGRSVMRPAWLLASSMSHVSGLPGSAYRSSTLNDQSGYYLIDVKPVASDVLHEPMLGAPRPTLFPLIQTLTGPIGGLIDGLVQPISRGPNTNTQPQIGRQNANQEKLSYKPVYKPPSEHNTSQSKEESPAENHYENENGQQELNNEFGSQYFGSREFQDNLVRHLIVVRNKP
ncbi:uncharacterized protein LOC129005308 [Macrosteles quadrilineatus]|uniref:uncharacterized protein LOC129005308 n=1 Tax=Macrosteles quadrilineatus TaxID=74068 RepID=UPI0023E1D4F1|nr:uncharacterized protein LOC129005308 [Macrosteles quadrilineatus]